MARKGYPEDEPVPRPRAISLRAETGDAGDAARASQADEPFDSRLLDLEPEEGSPFLRAQKRVPVRRGPLRGRAANRLKHVVFAGAVVGSVALLAAGLTRYGRRSWRFRLDSSEQIQLAGNRYVSRTQVTEIFGADISRNVFLIPLEERKRQLEQISWVESATVMRLLPNRIQVDLRERTPVAYAQVGTRIRLVDSYGVLMGVPPGARYSFPVIIGFTGAEPLSARAARVAVYQALVRDLDSGDANYSRDLSEVDLADPEDVKITVADPRGSEVLIHLGSSDFLNRYKVFVAHIQEWRQQFQKLDSVDLRYDGQVIVHPGATATQEAQPSPAAPAASADAPRRSGRRTGRWPARRRR